MWIKWETQEGSEYINADYFVLDRYRNPNLYQIYLYTGGVGILGSVPKTINAEENLPYRTYEPYQGGWIDWFNEVKDEGDMRIFAVRCSKGANKIAIPKDLRPYVAKLRAGKKTVFAERDLALSVDFETYPL